MIKNICNVKKLLNYIIRITKFNDKNTLFFPITQKKIPVFFDNGDF